MALRTIRELGDPVLTKKCKEITSVSPRITMLAEDLLDTMYEADGVGLAAPQVGILKRIVVVDIGDENDPNSPYILTNPEVVETSGEQTDYEGCLSYPGKYGKVTRPDHAKVKAFNLDMEPIVVEADGLLARAFLHEIDHLEGIMFVEHVEGDIVSAEDLAADTEDDED